MLSHSDWGSIQSTLVAIGTKLMQQGGDINGPHFHAPREVIQITEFESATKLKLPEDFSHFLTELCGGWEFSWNLHRSSNRGLFEDGFLGSLQGGNDRGNFIGQPQYSLLAFYQNLVEMVREWVEHGGVNESDFQIVKNCFPLYICDYGSNFVALRLDSQLNEIVYLDHDTGFHITPNHVLGRGFPGFLQKYSRLGCPSLDHTWPIYDENREIDSTLPVVQEWENLLKS